jgi:hypothetical protein
MKAIYERLERLLPVLCLDAQNCAGIKSFSRTTSGPHELSRKVPTWMTVDKLVYRKLVLLIIQ